VVGYNVQSAVDEKHHLILTHEVTNATTDRQQLDKMGKRLGLHGAALLRRTP
jgi:hypothetical protein